MKPFEKPSVSVIIPTYNSSTTIIRAIESALQQTHFCEVIVVDDGSTDETREILGPYISSNRIIYHYQENAGCGNARNYGIGIAQGEYVAFLDADDYWVTEKIEQQLRIMISDPQIIVCSTESYLVDSVSGNIWIKKRDIIHRLRSGNITRFFAFHNIITLSSALVKKDILIQVGGFETDRGLMMVADLDLWLKMAPLGRFFSISTPLMFYQIRHGIKPIQIAENHRQVAVVFKKRLMNGPFRVFFWFSVGFLRSQFLYFLTSMKIFSIYKNIGIQGIVKELFRRIYTYFDFFVYPYLIYKLKHTTFNSIKDLCDFSYRNSLRVFIPGQVESEITSFLEYAQKIKPKNIIEIGTAHGGNLFLLTKITRDDAKIISLDLPDGDYGGGYLKRKTTLYNCFATGNQRIFLLRENSHNIGTHDKVKDILMGEKVDILFIDADHSYAGVKLDFEMYRDFVRPGGIIGFHDISNDPDETYGVHKFWNEIKKDYKYKEIIENPNRKGYGIGIILV